KLVGVAGGLHPELEIALEALDFQPILAHRAQIVAARAKHHLFTRLLELGTIICADGSRAHNQNLHRSLRLLRRKPIVSLNPPPSLVTITRESANEPSYDAA